jgi:hypothetical protein
MTGADNTVIILLRTIPTEPGSDSCLASVSGKIFASKNPKRPI